MALLDLPNELLLSIAQFLDCERNIDSLARCNRRLFSIATDHLYHYNVRNSRASALVWAAKRGRLGTLQRAIATGVSIRDHVLLPVAAQEGHTEVVELLLENGVDVSMPSESGRTPLHHAAESGHGKIVELLMDHGACAAATTPEGWTPLLLALYYGKAHAVKSLVAKGDDVTRPGRLGWTPMIIWAGRCSGNVEIGQLLLDKGADVNSICCGWTPLTLVATKGDAGSIRFLLARGADIMTANGFGYSALLIAADTNNHGDVVEALLSNGADVSTTDPDGLTALHIASENGRVDVAELLLASGADATVGNKSG